jgi:hypothetical protein
MSPAYTQHNRTNPYRNIISRWHQLQLNTHIPSTPQHTRCEPAFPNTFGDLPGWIEPATIIRLVTQNFQGFKPLANDEKLQNGIANLVAPQAGIACLTEMNVEWRRISCRQGCIYQTLFLMEKQIQLLLIDILYFTGGTVTSETYQWTHHVNLAGEDYMGGSRWSYFTILGKDKNLLVITCYRV